MGPELSDGASEVDGILVTGALLATLENPVERDGATETLPGTCDEEMGGVAELSGAIEDCAGTKLDAAIELGAFVNEATELGAVIELSGGFKEETGAELSAIEVELGATTELLGAIEDCAGAELVAGAELSGATEDCADTELDAVAELSGGLEDEDTAKPAAAAKLVDCIEDCAEAELSADCGEAELSAVAELSGGLEDEETAKPAAAAKLVELAAAAELSGAMEDCVGAELLAFVELWGPAEECAGAELGAVEDCATAELGAFDEFGDDAAAEVAAAAELWGAIEDCAEAELVAAAELSGAIEDCAAAELSGAFEDEATLEGGAELDVATRLSGGIGDEVTELGAIAELEDSPSAELKAATDMRVAGYPRQTTEKAEAGQNLEAQRIERKADLRSQKRISRGHQDFRSDANQHFAKGSRRTPEGKRRPNLVLDVRKSSYYWCYYQVDFRVSQGIPCKTIPIQRVPPHRHAQKTHLSGNAVEDDAAVRTTVARTNAEPFIFDVRAHEWGVSTAGVP
ncbi:hypothetical protein B0H11DRAFT_1900770 [Mycena galericulata]|nr:hypothetical protein B0H11DRAFT_1900770 [Mycena galericulata]